MRQQQTECLIWRTPAVMVARHDYGNVVTVQSSRAGGDYVITGMAELHLDNLDDVGRAKLTTWVVDQNRLGSGPANITPDAVNRARATRRLSVLERRDRLLMYLGFRLADIGDKLKVAGNVDEVLAKNQQELLAWTESLKDSEIYTLIDLCVDEGLIKRLRNDQYIQLTAHGYERIAQAAEANPRASQAFVAMWFDASMQKAYDRGVAPAIHESGYSPLRIDQKEHINKIDDEIIAELRRSRFIVADFTSEADKPRGGVYFEAGMAYGLNIPVIWTCRKDMIEGIHFDTRQFNHIAWDNSQDLYSTLKQRIRAVIGFGPLTDQIKT